MVYKWSILIGGLYATYHLLRAPETTIDETNIFAPKNGWVGRRSFPIGEAYFQGFLLLVSGSVDAGGQFFQIIIAK